MGVIIGVVVLLTSLALVAAMMYSEWSLGTPQQPLAEKGAPQASSRAKRPAAKGKKAPAKKPAKKKK